MKRSTSIAVLAALALIIGLGSCSKNDKPLVSPASGAAVPSATAPAETSPASDPHAANASVIPAGVGHKASVLDVLQAGEYTYIQVQENGKQFWVATVQAKASKGDIIEFADSPIFPSFQSKALNRTFDNLMMVSGIRNDTQP